MRTVRQTDRMRKKGYMMNECVMIDYANNKGSTTNTGRLWQSNNAANEILKLISVVTEKILENQNLLEEFFVSSTAANVRCQLAYQTMAK